MQSYVVEVQGYQITIQDGGRRHFEFFDINEIYGNINRHYLK